MLTNLGFMMIVSLLLLLLGYRYYSRWIGKKLGLDPERKTPAYTHQDGVDFVPAKPPVLLAHHFAAIAAAGPIVGPTLAEYYGFLPAWLWVILGVIFFGAVHDMVALFLSVREDGRSVVEIARRTLGGGVYFFFLLFALFLCILVTSAFVDITGVALTSHYPAHSLKVNPQETFLRIREFGGEPHVMIGGIASTSAVIMTFLAPFLGFLLYKKELSPRKVGVLAFLVAVLSVLVGLFYPIQFPQKTWITIILLYTVIATYVPIWVIIQPRDYINVQFLYLGLLALITGSISLGIQGASLDIPLINFEEDPIRRLGIPWPFLFITIACGAISGAHGLIASGTTSKQISNERYIPMIGYGGMLLESVLALCVLFTIAGGLGFSEYVKIVWPTEGKGNPALAFALGVGYALDKGVGVPVLWGTLFGILLVEGFVITTVDVIMRLSRYLLEELWIVLFQGKEKVPTLLLERWVNTLIPAFFVAILAFSRGYEPIWPLFGATNQLLAGLTLIVATAWLLKKGKTSFFAWIPAGFMTITTLSALGIQLVKRWEKGDYLLVSLATALILLAVGMIFAVLKTRQSGGEKRLWGVK